MYEVMTYTHLKLSVHLEERLSQMTMTEIIKVKKKSEVSRIAPAAFFTIW